MKRIVTLILAVILVAPSLSTVVAFAEDNTGSSTQDTTQSSSGDSSSDTSEQTQTEAEKESFQHRIDGFKDALKTKLTNLEKAHIKLKCVAAQGLISSVKGREHGIETSRGEVYKNIIDRLNDLSTKLKNAGVDTTEFNADITTLQAKITTFNTDLAAYKQDITDLVAVDCKTDPDGFQAALDTTRAALQKVNQDATDIRTYVTDTLKPLLTQIRSELGKSEDTTSDNKTTQEGDQ